MFVRPAWKPHSEDEMYAFMDENPWALLVTNGGDGPLATNLPLMLDRSCGEKGALIGHLARANAHADVLFSSDTPSLAIFSGPYSYVTGSWYPQRDMPPTFYYTAVHAYGSIRRQEEDELRHWVSALTARMEAAVPDGWRTTEIQEDGITRRLRAIVGFEIQINRFEGKFKLGQDESRERALAVARYIEARNCRNDRQLAELIRKYNLG